MDDSIAKWVGIAIIIVVIVVIGWTGSNTADRVSKTENKLNAFSQAFDTTETIKLRSDVIDRSGLVKKP